VSEAQMVILRALGTVPGTCWQRTDGLRCESRVMGLTDWQYRWALIVLRWKGLIERGRDGSMRPLPTYRLTNGGRCYLEVLAKSGASS
jgi:hypothetical protein